MLFINVFNISALNPVIIPSAPLISDGWNLFEDFNNVFFGNISFNNLTDVVPSVIFRYMKLPGPGIPHTCNGKDNDWIGKRKTNRYTK